MSAGQPPQEVVKECSTAGVVLVALGKTLIHIRAASLDAILVPLEWWVIYGGDRVRDEQLVALGFELHSVHGEVGDLVVGAFSALVERYVGLCREVPVVVLADRGRGIGTLEQPFRNLHKNRATGATRLLRSAA